LIKTAIVASVSPTSFEALAMSADVGAAFKLAAECGFDGVEIAVRDPGAVKADEIKAMAKDHGLGIAAIGTWQAWGEEGLSLTGPDENVRKKAIERLKKQLTLGAELGAWIIIGLIRGTVDRKEDVPAALDVLAEGMAELGSYASEAGAPGLLVEPINRYETRLLNSVDQTLTFLDRLNAPSVKLLADTFHMNIEDRDVAAAIVKAGTRLGHVHFADSNRWAPGQGHTDFAPILEALADLSYSGYLSAEIMPEPSPEEAVRLTGQFFKSIRAGKVGGQAP